MTLAASDAVILVATVAVTLEVSAIISAGYTTPTLICSSKSSDTLKQETVAHLSGLYD